MKKGFFLISVILVMALCSPAAQVIAAGTPAAGDTVTASGTFSPNTWVAIKVLDGSGDIVFYDNVKSDATGAYSCRFVIPSSDGSLQVIAGYGVNIAAPSINIVQPPSKDDSGDRNNGSGNVIPSPKKTIAVTEVSCDLFRERAGEISAGADMEKAFSTSVEMKVTNTKENEVSFGLGPGIELYPFDISLFIKGTNLKTQPARGYAVTITLPVPENLIDQKEMLALVYKSGSGVVTALDSRLRQKNNIWYLVFEAKEFSPYAIAVRRTGSYDAAAGVPYYLDAKGNRVFLGLASKGRYIAPGGVTVFAAQNAKSFTDVSGHWAEGYISFVTEREIFLGAGNNTFSPDMGMTRAMFATVIGRLFERSYGEINTDSDNTEYYDKYINWAAKNNIIKGYGDNRFGPDDRITREQMAAILYRFADFLGIHPAGTDIALNYPDASDISDYAKTAALYCQTTGIIGGRSGGVFVPEGTATRSEVAAIIRRFVELAVK